MIAGFITEDRAIMLHKIIAGHIIIDHIPGIFMAIAAGNR
jgi:hypothetical protein